jgi:hypothetical protein
LADFNGVLLDPPAANSGGVSSSTPSDYQGVLATTAVVVSGYPVELVRDFNGVLLMLDQEHECG